MSASSVPDPADVARAAQMRQIMEEIWTDGVMPHRARISRIAVAGDVAVVFYQQDLTSPETRAAFEKLRGSEPGPVVRLTRTRAARLFANVSDRVARRWVTTKAPPGLEKIFLVARRGYFLVNHNPARKRCWLEPGSADASWLGCVA